MAWYLVEHSGATLYFHFYFYLYHFFVRGAVIEKTGEIWLYWIILDRYEPKFSVYRNSKHHLREEPYGRRTRAPPYTFILYLFCKESTK